MCAGPDAPDREDTGFSTQPSGDQSGKLGHTCPHMALIGLKQNIALIMDAREEGTRSSYKVHVITKPKINDGGLSQFSRL